MKIEFTFAGSSLALLGLDIYLYLPLSLAPRLEAIYGESMRSYMVFIGLDGMGMPTQVVPKGSTTWMSFSCNLYMIEITGSTIPTSS